MTDYTNDEIYLELRQMHRRLMAFVCLVASLFFTVGLAMLNTEYIPVLILVALKTMLLTLVWLYANRNDGLVRRFIEWVLGGSNDWDRDLEEEVEA